MFEKIVVLTIIKYMTVHVYIDIICNDKNIP